MARYFTQPKQEAPRAEYDWFMPLVPHLTVPEHEAQDTGLVDHKGNPIKRSPNPIGFGRDEEW